MYVQIIITVSSGVADLVGVFNSDEKALKCINDIIVEETGKEIKSLEDFLAWKDEESSGDFEVIWYSSKVE